MRPVTKCSFKSLICDSKGLSAGRVMSLWSMLVGSAIGLIGVMKGIEPAGLAEVCGVFIGCAFTGKVISKHIETRNE